MTDMWGDLVWAALADLKTRLVLVMPGILAMLTLAVVGLAGAWIAARVTRRVAQAVAFGLSHIADARAAGEPVAFVVLVTGLAGWVFGHLADRSGSLAAPMLAHLAVNEAGAIAVLLVQRSTRCACPG